MNFHDQAKEFLFSQCLIFFGLESYKCVHWFAPWDCYKCIPRRKWVDSLERDYCISPVGWQRDDTLGWHLAGECKECK